MGMFNRIMVDCPWCGHSNEHQSKLGSCALSESSVECAELADLAAIEGAHRCEACDEPYIIRVQRMVNVRKGRKE